ncbi:MAG: 4-hydroxyphenylpyruvate dioxygenase [Bdellovibrionaceae bacterium]|nr:4-hydroxyphenylpyruvate dioxygenase [Pseudobdellovibrionaceae bacterium]
MNQNQNTTFNPIGLDGMEFIEYTSPNPEELAQLFLKLGFVKIGNHKTKKVELYRQRGVNFILNRETQSFAEVFQKAHGPSICATGFRVKDAKKALEEAVKRGAKICTDKGHSFPAIYGIGESLIYFIDSYENDTVYDNDFEFVDNKLQKGFGMLTIDHMTNNIPKGQMAEWEEFYQRIFNFRVIRFFDIKGKETGLLSKAMRSPCNKITIPINEPTESKSQIQEYLDEYKGSGIQHVALLTTDIVKTVKQLQQNGIEFLYTPDTYYETIPKRLPIVTEDIEVLKEYKVLVDGDDEGYLLQIFTKNLIGPIFFEIIQRKKHDGFGEGNFQALFDSIEEDQRRRGYLQ